jgi:hypothetical protein
MALDTPENIRNEGIELYKAAEVKLRQAQKAIFDIIPAIEAGHGAGMMGELQTKRMVAELKATAGTTATAEAAVWLSHAEATKIVQDFGLEVIAEGGGTR